MASNEATVAALTEIKSALGEAGQEFDAKLAELAELVKGNTSEEADALIAELRVMAAALKDKVPNQPAE